MENNWQPFGDTFIHIDYGDEDYSVPYRRTRKEKDVDREWARMLNQRVKWHPSFANHLQGKAIMRGVFAAARRRG